jgi:acetyl coenzyme A synthetase (ADP forming)-like protein
MKRSSRARAKPAPAQSLDAIFRPHSIAVIGASRQKSAIGREILNNLIQFEFNGKVFPVNPKASVVASMKCYASVSKIPDEVDLAIVVVPRERVLGVVRECARKGVRGIVVISAGFREAGKEGAAIEETLRRTVRRTGIRMVGPNCMGVINTAPDVRLNASFAAARPSQGLAAFVSQSGALGEAILDNAGELGLGISMFVSMGNKTDVSGNDLLEYWEHDPSVQVILMYLESFGNPRKFTEIARRITRRKPIVTVKAGRTAAGARAAISHTGSIVGLDIATESLLEQCGVIRVSTMEEMFTVAPAFALQPVPKGPRVGIVTNAGGPGILATDAAVNLGLSLPAFEPSTMSALKKILPREATPGNPVDLIASATPERFEEALRVVARDKNVDSVIAIFVSPVTVDAVAVARGIVRAVEGCAKTILAVFMSKAVSAEGAAILRASGLPVYLYPEEAASALAAMNRYRSLRDRPVGKIPRFRTDAARAARVLRSARRARRELLGREETEELLRAYGLPVVPSRVVSKAAEAIEFSHRVGYPVVLKAVSESIVHKTDVGGVKLDLRNGDEVWAAFEQLQKLRSRAADLKVQVQKMIRGGRELILGMVLDSKFGPLLMAGLGGIYVELMRDVSVRVHPLTDKGARRMLRSLRGYPLLEGVRGEAGVDLATVEEFLLRLSQMISEQDSIREVDINPLIATPQAKDCYVVDARIRIDPGAVNRKRSA